MPPHPPPILSPPLRRAGLSPAPGDPLSRFPQLLLLPWLQGVGLGSQPGAPGLPSSTGLGLSAVSVAGETGRPFQPWLHTLRNRSPHTHREQASPASNCSPRDS